MKFKLPSMQTNKLKKLINGLFIIFIFGMIIILYSSNGLTKKKEENSPLISQNTTDNSEQSTVSYGESIEKKLEDELSKIDGVGKVDVMLTMKTKGEIVVNKDAPYNTADTSESDGEGGSRESKDVDQQETTVIVQNSDGSEQAIIVKEFLPEVNGVLIIAEGGDNIVVKNNLINVVKVLLDLPAHKIEVMKMVTN